MSGCILLSLERDPMRPPQFQHPSTTVKDFGNKMKKQVLHRPNRIDGLFWKVFGKAFQHARDILREASVKENAGAFIYSISINFCFHSCIRLYELSTGAVSIPPHALSCYSGPTAHTVFPCLRAFGALTISSKPLEAADALVPSQHF